MEPVITEGEVRTVEKVSSHVVSNKTVVQRTTNTNSTLVNRYDADGNIKSSEVDSESWEDRNTKTFEWSDPADKPLDAAADNNNSSTPSLEVTTGDELSVEKFLASEQQSSPNNAPAGATLVLTTTDLIPGVSWSGTSVEQRESNVVAANEADVQLSQRTTTNQAGECWSRSGEAVWVTETAKKTAAPTTPSTPETVAIENKVASGEPVAASAGPADAAPTIPTGAVATQAPAQAVPVTTAAAAAVVVEPPPAMSVEERRRKRCLENRARKAATAAVGSAVGQPSVA